MAKKAKFNSFSSQVFMFKSSLCAFMSKPGFACPSTSTPEYFRISSADMLCMWVCLCVFVCVHMFVALGLLNIAAEVSPYNHSRLDRT